MCDSHSKKYSHHISPDDVNVMLSNHLTDNSVNSKVGIVKSSNCIINIEYVLQDEKIIFEVFKSTVDSHCILKRDINLKSNNPSNDINDFISSLTDAPIGNMKINKTCQTEPMDFVKMDAKKRTKSPVIKKVAFECPVRDTSERVNYAPYKETYAVSNFKFIEPKPIETGDGKHNFCALDFDGTSSKRRRHSAKTKGTKTMTLKKVQSDTNIFRTTKPSLKQKTENHVTDKLKKTEPSSNKENEERNKKDNERTRKKRHRKRNDESANKPECVKNDGAQFEIVLTPRKTQNCSSDTSRTDPKTETISLVRQKLRKIIVKSNTLELLTKPEMKSVGLQTTASSFVEKSILLKDLYAKPYFNSSIKSLKSMNSGDANMEEINLQQEQPLIVQNEIKPESIDKEGRKNRRCNLTKTVNPCFEIKTDPETLVTTPQKIRPTIPRRRIDINEKNAVGNINLEDLKTKQQIASKIPNIHPYIPRMTRDDKHLVSDNLVVKDLNMLRAHISNWLTNSRKQRNVNDEEYSKEVDELCSMITSLLHNNPNEQIVNAKCTKMEENVEKPSVNDSKSPREKCITVKEALTPNKVLKKTIIKTPNIHFQKNKSPSLKMWHNQENNITINNHNAVQLVKNKIVKNNDQKRILQNAFQRDISNVSSKPIDIKICNYNKDNIKKLKRIMKHEEHITNQNFHLKIENIPNKNVNKRLQFDIKNEMNEYGNAADKIIQKDAVQNDSLTNKQTDNAPLNKNTFSKQYESRRINARFFEQCMESKKRKSSELSVSTVTMNSQIEEFKPVTSDTQKKKSTIPEKSRTYNEMTRTRTAPTKSTLAKRKIQYLSRNSLNTDKASQVTTQYPSLQQSKSEIFSLPNTNDTANKVIEITRPQNPGSIRNSTFLFTKVNMDNNFESCFKKRKEYAMNLKLKKKTQSEGQQSSNLNQTIDNSPQPKLKQKHTTPRRSWNTNFFNYNYLHTPQYKNLTKISERIEKQDNTSVPKVVLPIEEINSALLTEKKEKSPLFAYPAPNFDDSDYKSVSEKEGNGTYTFLKDYPLTENTQQVYLTTNTQTSSYNNAEQSKRKPSILKSTNKAEKSPQNDKKQNSKNESRKSSRNSTLTKHNNGKNTLQSNETEVRKALLGEIKTACCSLCCKTKPNVDSDSTFKKNSENTANSTDHPQTNVVQKKTVKIDDPLEKKHNHDDEKYILGPKDSFEYWRCSVVENQQFGTKDFGSEKDKNIQQNNSEENSNDMTFYSSQSIAVNNLSTTNSKELKQLDTTNSLKSLINQNEDTITVLLDNCNTNKNLHKTVSDVESELGLVCDLGEQKYGDSDRLEGDKQLTKKKSKLFSQFNKFFGKKSSKKICK